MKRQISMRLKEENYESIKELSKFEHLGRSIILRQALEIGLERLKKETAINLYRDGKLTLSEASQLAELGAEEMMEELIKHGIKSELSIKEFERDRETASKIA